jgi:hypothetical protein
MNKLTVRHLRKAGACSDQVRLFERTFPNGVRPTMRAWAKAWAAGLDVFWCASLLRGPALAEYERVRGPALAEYERVRGPAWAEYERVRGPAWAEYERVRGAAWAEHERVTGAAWAEYERVRGPALAEYERVRGPAFTKALRQTLDGEG